MKKKFIPLFFLSIVLFNGCSKNIISIATQNTEPNPSPAPAQMIAGIGQTDLTPPPGYPMAGYSINGRISRGYWIRPKATALYLRDVKGTPFVFVTTDLWGITDGQKLKVLDTLRKISRYNFIGESELLLAATHAHHSLGVNVPDKAYGAASIGLGFDQDAFDFTVFQIATAIRAAIDSARPSTVFFAADTVSGIAKNRSVKAYLRNNPAERAVYFGQPPARYSEDVTKKEIESMIDQQLTLITVKDLDGRTKAMLASYPVHPTATGDQTEVYSADIFGLAAAYAKRDAGSHPLVAFYNGAEGDVAADYEFHNRADAVRIAEKLSKGILRISRSSNQTAVTGNIIHRVKTIEIADTKVHFDSLDMDCYCMLPDTVVTTAKKAMVGVSVFAGASDGRTSLSSFGIGDGVKTDKWDPAQGYKMPAGKFLVGHVFGEIIKSKLFRSIASGLIVSDPVSKFAISIHQVGPVSFAGMPGEFTTMLGRRIKKTIAYQFNTGINNISLVGLADGYASYITTPCEYNEQAYEGASDYFGISTGQVFVKAFDTLAMDNNAGITINKGRKTEYNVGTIVSYGPHHLGRLQTWDVEERLQNILYAADGTKLHSHIIPPDIASTQTIKIAHDEVAAYSFEDGAGGLGSAGNCYPEVFLLNDAGEKMTMIEYMLTIDKYSGEQCTWTIRLLDVECLKNKKLHFVVKPLSTIVPKNSAYFQIE